MTFIPPVVGNLKQVLLFWIYIMYFITCPITYILYHFSLILHSFFRQILVLLFTSYCFTVDLLILNHPSRIKVNYEPMVHIGSVKQSARIIMINIPSTTTSSTISYPSSISQATTTTDTNINGVTSSTHTIHSTPPSCSMDKSIGNGERAVCRFRFLYFPEYISTGDDMLIREDRTKGVGTVLRLCW